MAVPDTMELETRVKEQETLLHKKDVLIESLCTALNNVYSLYYDDPKGEFLKEEKGDINIKRNLIPNATSDNTKTCMLCLFSLNDSLHGSFSPRIFKLHCEHTFHLLCLHETIQRRECRKSCSTCWSDINDDEQNIICQLSKQEKKDINKHNHVLASDISRY